MEHILHWSRHLLPARILRDRHTRACNAILRDPICEAFITRLPPLRREVGREELMFYLSLLDGPITHAVLGEFVNDGLLRDLPAYRAAPGYSETCVFQDVVKVLEALKLRKGIRVGEIDRFIFEWTESASRQSTLIAAYETFERANAGWHLVLLAFPEFYSRNCSNHVSKVVCRMFFQ